MDNGFIVFDSVLLPHSAFLNRHQEINARGEYKVHVDPKKRFGLTLGALSSGRVFISAAVLWFLLVYECGASDSWLGCCNIA